MQLAIVRSATRWVLQKWRAVVRPAVVKLIVRWVSRKWRAVMQLVRSVARGVLRGWQTFRQFLRESPRSKVLFCIFLSFLAGFGVLLLYAVWRMTPPGCEGGFWLCHGLGVERKESVVRGLGIAIAGTLSIWAVYVAQRRADMMEERLAQERFRDAVGHLGHDSESVRLNGAYALFRLAVREEAFREWIARTLCLHIVAVTRAEKYREAYAEAPSTEIEILMRLLFEEKSLESEGLRSEAEREAFRKEFPINLSRGYFPGLALRDARFRGACLAGAEFQGAGLAGARFQRVDLEGVEFQGAGLAGAEFQGVDLAGARFRGAGLAGARFQETYLTRAQFQGAGLAGARFRGASLAGAEFQGADLADAEFQGAYLVGAQFQGADLADAEFQGAYLVGAQFQGADLADAEFQGADLTVAQFQGAKLTGAQFQGAYLSYGQFQLADLTVAPFHCAASLEKGIALFKQRMKEGIGRETDVSGAIFAGGLEQEKVGQMAEKLGQASRVSKKEIQAFKRSLGKHVGREASHVLPDEAQGGTYGVAHALAWIEEYEEAIKEARKVYKQAIM